MKIPCRKVLQAAPGMASRLRRRNREWAKVVKLAGIERTRARKKMPAMSASGWIVLQNYF
jgi:hypothetical protein